MTSHKSNGKNTRNKPNFNPVILNIIVRRHRLWPTESGFHVSSAVQQNGNPTNVEKKLARFMLEFTGPNPKIYRLQYTQIKYPGLSQNRVRIIDLKSIRFKKYRWQPSLAWDGLYRKIDCLQSKLNIPNRRMTMKYFYQFRSMLLISLTSLLLVQHSHAYGYSKSVGGVSKMVGEISFLQLNDLRNTNNLSKFEKKFDVNIVLEKSPGLVFGFDFG